MNFNFKFLALLLIWSSGSYGIQQDKLKKLLPSLHKNVRLVSPLKSVLKNHTLYRISFEPRNFKSITIIESNKELLKVPESSFSRFSLFMNDFIKTEGIKLVNTEEAGLFAANIHLLFDPVPHKFTCSKESFYFICGAPSLNFRIQLFKDGRHSPLPK